MLNEVAFVCANHLFTSKYMAIKNCYLLPQISFYRDTLLLKNHIYFIHSPMRNKYSLRNVCFINLRRTNPSISDPTSRDRHQHPLACSDLPSVLVKHEFAPCQSGACAHLATHPAPSHPPPSIKIRVVDGSTVNPLRANHPPPLNLVDINDNTPFDPLITPLSTAPVIVRIGIPRLHPFASRHFPICPFRPHKVAPSLREPPKSYPQRPRRRDGATRGATTPDWSPCDLPTPRL